MFPQLDPAHIIALHCPLCPFLTLSVTRLFEHCMGHDVPCECALLQCTECGSVSTHEGLLKEHAAAIHAGGATADLQPQQPAAASIKQLSRTTLNGRAVAAASAVASLDLNGDDDSDGSHLCLFCEERCPGGGPEFESHCEQAHGLRGVNAQAIRGRIRDLVAGALLGTGTCSGGLLAAAVAAAAASHAVGYGGIGGAAAHGDGQLDSGFSSDRQQPELHQLNQPAASSDLILSHQQQHQLMPFVVGGGGVSGGGNVGRANRSRGSVGSPAIGATPSAAKRVKLEPRRVHYHNNHRLYQHHHQLPYHPSSLSTSDAEAADDALSSVSPPPHSQAQLAPSTTGLSASSLSFLTSAPPQHQQHHKQSSQSSQQQQQQQLHARSTAGRPSLVPLSERLAEMGGVLLEDTAPYSTRCIYCQRVVRLSSRSCTNFKIHRQRCQEHLAQAAVTAAVATNSGGGAFAGTSGDLLDDDVDEGGGEGGCVGVGDSEIEAEVVQIGGSGGGAGGGDSPYDSGSRNGDDDPLGVSE